MITATLSTANAKATGSHFEGSAGGSEVGNSSFRHVPALSLGTSQNDGSTTPNSIGMALFILA